ncbi:MAG: hypothetical protein HN337_03990 [Deltaproteobacteria bacterium]|jgi:hypothetical protein|nr:hypothetical protein [Deltaproteobacteria bacterium]
MDEMKSDFEDMSKRGYEASLSVIKSIVPYIDGNELMGRKLSDYVQDIACALAQKQISSRVTVLNESVMAEVAAKCCEVIVMLSYCRDLHGQFINAHLCEKLIETYRSIQKEMLVHHGDAHHLRMEGVGC